jgi:hypothetical protein
MVKSNLEKDLLKRTGLPFLKRLFFEKIEKLIRHFLHFLPESAKIRNETEEKDFNLFFLSMVLRTDVNQEAITHGWQSFEKAANDGLEVRQVFLKRKLSSHRMS